MKYTRKAVYTGRRHDVFSGKVYHRFELLPEKEEILFSKTKGCYVGYTYQCTAKTMPRKPEMTDDPRIVNAGWQGADAAAGAWIQKRREQTKKQNEIAKLSKDKINEAVNAIVPLITDLELPSDASVLVTHLYQLALKKKKGLK